jgi:hypothetical protein
MLLRKGEIQMMMIAKRNLIDAVETGMFLLPELPGRVEWLHVPGLLGREIDGADKGHPADKGYPSDPFVSIVGAARLTPAIAAGAIQRVYEYFTGQNKAFGWIVDDRSTPSDLAARLEGIGMEKALEMAGMAYARLDLPVQGNPAVSIREVTPGDLDVAGPLLAEAIGFTPQGACATVEALALSPSPLRRRAYLAYLGGDPSPVAYASMIYFPDRPIVELYCAATLEKARCQGVYTSLVSRRLADAHRDGMQAAVIQAVRHTSAPVCQKLGFVELCNLDWYIWTPEKE